MSNAFISILELNTKVSKEELAAKVIDEVEMVQRVMPDRFLPDTRYYGGKIYQDDRIKIIIRPVYKSDSSVLNNYVVEYRSNENYGVVFTAERLASQDKTGIMPAVFIVKDNSWLRQLASII